MTGKAKGAIYAIGAGLAAVAGLIGAVALWHNAGDGRPARMAERGAGPARMCLQSEIRFIAGAEKKCYARSELAALMGGAVLDDDGVTVGVNLSHPTDLSQDLAVVATCDDYRLKTREGWYALSTREMRREAFFARACGVLAALEAARPAEVTYFADGAASLEDMRSLAATAPFAIGEVSGAGPAEVARDARDNWTISAAGQTARVQEIAHADFDRNGRGDILVFVVVSAEGGTTAAGMVGLIDKPSAAGAVRFVRL